MKKLQVGFIPIRELADWFGISYETFRHTSQKRYEALKEFCDYEKAYRGINVKEVYIEEYEKLPKPEDCAYVISKIYKNPSPLNSAKGISILFKKEVKPELSENQSYYQIKKILDLLFGHFPSKALIASGAVGQRERVWAVKIMQEDNCYRFLTEDEEVKFKELIKKAFVSDEKIDEFMKTSLMDDADKVEWIENFQFECGIQMVRVQIYDFIKNFNMSKRDRQMLKIIIEKAKQMGWDIPDLL